MQTGELSRTKLERLIFEGGLTLRAAGALMGCSGEYVRLLAKGKRQAGARVGPVLAHLLAGRTTLEILRLKREKPTGGDFVNASQPAAGAAITAPADFLESQQP